MRRITRNRDLVAPPARVWDLLADFESIGRWAPNVDHSCLLTELADGVGAVRRVQSGRTTVVERVVTWEPELMLGYTIAGLPSIARTATNTWVVRPADGGTVVSLITDIDTANNPLGLLAGRVIGRKLSEASDVMLDGLERAVAGTSRASLPARDRQL